MITTRLLLLAIASILAFMLAWTNPGPGDKKLPRHKNEVRTHIAVPQMYKRVVTSTKKSNGVASFTLTPSAGSARTSFHDNIVEEPVLVVEEEEP